MLKSPAHLPISILALCSMHLYEDALSQMALVSKRLHLATRHRRSMPKQLDCTSLDLEALERRYSQMTIVARGTGVKRLLPPLGTLTYCLYEKPLAPYRDYEGPSESEVIAKQAAETDMVVQILERNKGVPVLVLDVKLANTDPYGDDGASKEALLSTIRRLAHAAHCKNGTLEVLIEDPRSDTENPSDAIVSAMLAQFANRSAIGSITLTLAHLDDAIQTLQNGVATTSLKTLVLKECYLQTNDATKSSQLAGLDNLSLFWGDVPFGIIQSNAASLRKLVIVGPMHKYGNGVKVGRLGDVLVMPPFRAHFPELRDLTLEVQRDSLAQCSVEDMFLVGDDITMPAVTHLTTHVPDIIGNGRNISGIMERFPSLRRWTVVEGNHRLTVADASDTDGGQWQSPVYSALVDTCRARHVELEVSSSSGYCYGRTMLAAEMQRMEALQHNLWRYSLRVSGEEFEEPFVLNEPMTLPALRELYLHVGELSEEDSPGRKHRGDNLVGMVRQISAPRCLEMKVDFGVRAEDLDVAKNFLNGLVSPPVFPNLKRITGRFRIGMRRADLTSDTELSMLSHFKTLISDLQTGTGIDFTDLEVEAMV